MSTWTLQKGYPLLIIDSIEWTSDNEAKIRLKQKPFKLLENTQGNSEEGSSWKLPLVVKSQSGKDEIVFKSVFEEQELEITIEKNISKDDWINFNPSGIGFYRVKYPEVS